MNTRKVNGLNRIKKLEKKVEKMYPNLASRSIEGFIEQIYNLPVLTVEEEYSLFKEYQENGNLKAMEKVIYHNIRYVANFANKLYNYGINRYDLIQEGTIGLMESAKSFDISVGVRFFTYAAFNVKNRMFSYIRKNWKMISLPDTKRVTKMFFNLRSRKKNHGWFSKEEVDTLSKEFGSPKEDVLKMEYFLHTGDVYIEQSHSEEDNTIVSFDSLGDNSSNLLENFTEEDYKSKLLGALSDAKKSLNERELIIIESRFSDEPETLQELSSKLGVSLERVRQIEKAAIAKLSKYIESNFKE